MDELNVVFSLDKVVNGIRYTIELATDNDKDYFLGVVDDASASAYPLDKEQLEVIHNAIGELLNK